MAPAPIWIEDVAGPTEVQSRYRELLAAAGRPLPWRMSHEEAGLVTAADGSDAATVDVDRQVSDAAAAAIAAWIVCAVNTCGGYRALSRRKII